MASEYYNYGMDLLGQGGINLISDTMNAILIDTADYTFNVAHDFLNDIPAAARVAVVTLSGKSISGGGIFTCNPIVFAGVTGDSSEVIVIYKHTGTESNSPLFIKIEHATTSDLVSNTVTITPDASGLFKY